MFSKFFEILVCICIGKFLNFKEIKNDISINIININIEKFELFDILPNPYFYLEYLENLTASDPIIWENTHNGIINKDYENTPIIWENTPIIWENTHKCIINKDYENIRMHPKTEPNLLCLSVCLSVCLYLLHYIFIK